MYVGLSNMKTDVFIATVLRCSRWNVLIFLRYFCNFFIYKNVRKIKKRDKNKKNVKKRKKILFTSIVLTGRAAQPFGGLELGR